MKKILLKQGLLFILTLAAFQINAQTHTFSSGLEGWATAYGAQGSNSGTVSHDPTGGESGDGALVLARTTNNSNFGLNPAGIDASTNKFIRIRFKNGTNGTQLRVQGSQPADNSGNKLTNTIFTITPNSNAYVTKYLDMSNTTNWDNTIDNFDILIRTNYADGEGTFILDEIEFLNGLPPATYSEFIKNPSFDDVVGGIDHITGNTTEYNRSLDNTVSKDGNNSFKMSFDKILPTKTTWNFTNYTHTYTSEIADKSIVEVKMWVKTSRTGATAPFKVIQRTKILLNDTEVKNPAEPDGDGSFPSDSQITTNTAGEWEELTFTYTVPGAFNKALFWLGIEFDAENTDANMKLNDIVWFDKMSVTISDPATASLRNNTLAGVSVYPNPASNQIKVNSLKGGEISLYNVLGAKVLSETTSTKKHTLNISNVSNGIYVLKIVSEGKSYTQKIIVR